MDVVLLEYPGRGEKIRQKVVTSAMDLAKILADEISGQLALPYAIYGHSMGTLIGFLLTRELRREGHPLPRFLFFTGSEGPSSRSHPKLRHLMSKEALIEELRSLGGLSDEVLSHKDIFDFFEPMIRGDFQAIETFNYEEEASFAIPITVAVGSQEEVTLEQARSWQKESTEPIELLQFSGNHFFVFSHVEKIVKLIAEKSVEESHFRN